MSPTDSFVPLDDDLGGNDVGARFRSSSHFALRADDTDDEDDCDDDVGSDEVVDAHSRWDEYRHYVDVEFRVGRLRRPAPLLSAVFLVAEGTAVGVGGAERVAGAVESVGGMADLAGEGFDFGGAVDGAGLAGADDWGELESADRCGRGNAVVVANCSRERIVILKVINISFRLRHDESYLLE